MAYELSLKMQGGSDHEFGIPLRLFRILEIINNHTRDRTLEHYSKSCGIPRSNILLTDSVLRVTDVLPDQHELFLKIEGDDEDDPEDNEPIVEYMFASYISVIYHLCTGDMKDPVLEPTGIIDEISRCMFKGERLIFEYDGEIDVFRLPSE